MDIVFRDFKQAQLIASGPLLSTTITPIAPPDDRDRLRHFYAGSSSFSIQSDVRYGILHHANTDARFSKSEGHAWVEVYVAYWKAIGEIIALNPDWTKVYEAWKEVANALIRGYSSAGFQAWTVPCLYVAGRYLRIFAIKADASARDKGAATFNGGFQDDVVGDVGKNEKLEDAARVVNRVFTLCISDRAPLEESRKWGLYYTTNLLFKTYFKLNSIGLSKNIVRALQASIADMPPVEAYPKSHIVTFKYYVGVILFLEEDYGKAEENLTAAWQMCHRDARRNHELILTYLIPCHLLTTHTLPTAHLLAPYPRLQKLFGPLGSCIRRGDLAGFDAALAAGESEFVKRRIYLTLERGRDIALRNLLRKVFLAGGFEEPKEGAAALRRTRIPVEEFAAAIRLGSNSENERLENDEVECLLANMIYKNLMKGYISRDRGIVVLSKGGQAFPGTGI
ncbi:cop9 signalosome complex subunit 12 [Lasallia pustulata]|uniref:Protein CSN12 homolog n=1 Tax=Lasallia pustulata TaxID=136370 RepID=A0A1W5D4A4_9LECA|nr:cop9 signalosome complex subunit 12 [Lasallia pustulata]